jgi:hypothetical protein
MGRPAEALGADAAQEVIRPMTSEELAAYLAALPVDDEPLTDEDIAAIEAGRLAIEHGDFATTEGIAALVAGS